jgi:ABC-2 type transport system ATP-binding protein
MSVHEYIDFFARAYGIRGERRREVVEGIEEFTNLTGIREKFLRTLSKGMKQRVNLARALVHDPAILVLDEPAAGLDPRARIELRELLKVLASRGKAVLISSHILAELGEMIDGVVIIEQGRMLRAGSVKEMRRQMGACIVLIRPLGDPDQLRRDLLEMPHVEKVSLAGGYVRVAVACEEERCCDLLKIIVDKGHRIAEFRQESGSLEDVFMSITKGDVQ